MSKIFIFAIGGTGSRVLRSLTMLLASGVKLGAEEIVPIIIDPDEANGNLGQTVDLLNKYRDIRQYLHFNNDRQNQFFKTMIGNLFSDYRLRIKDTRDKLFQEFISYSSLNKANQAMVKMLFSKKNLEDSMEIGFKGNPNIGSVVLNQIAHSEDFINFANSFSDGDKIFIISSIFGGTGASGFPLLVKTLREGKNFPNHNIINQAQIGALTILPYFKIEPKEGSAIDSSTFISKAKAALAYYEKNISRNGIVDAFYTLGDDVSVSNIYKYHDGGSPQANNAHLIEFFGASAIIHFSNKLFNSPTHLELGIKDIDNDVSFNNLHKKMHNMLYRPMVQFILMTNALIDKINLFDSKSFAATKTGNFDDLYQSNFFGNLSDFLTKYKEWLQEMKENRRSLDLFNLSCGDRPFEVVNDVKAKKIFSRYSDYDLFIDRLNKTIGNCKSKVKEDKFMEMFFLGTEKLVKEKLQN